MKTLLPGRTLLLSLLSFIVIIMIAACTKTASVDDQAGKTSIITTPASSVTYTGATSGGRIAHHMDSILQMGICFSNTAAPTIKDSVINSAIRSDTFNCVLRGLRANTQYFVRAFARTKADTIYGNQESFQTQGGTTSSGEVATRIYMSGGYTNDVYALDAATGNLLWNKKVPGTYASSAMYSRGKVIVKDNNNFITAFDTLGNVSWTRKLDGYNNDMQMIPVIADNGIVYCMDLLYIYALNATDGSVKWRTNNASPNDGDGTLRLRDGILYGVTEYGGLFAIDAATGEMKWQGSNYHGAELIFKDAIYLFAIGSSSYIYSLNRNTGIINWQSSPVTAYGMNMANAKYGRVYGADGWVIDSASISTNSTKVLPSMRFPYNSGNYPGSWPQGVVYPILADGLAISPMGICDAMTGDPVAAITGYKGGYFGLSGGAYLNHIFYYTTGEYEVYSPYTGGHWYSDVYAYDVIAKKILWDKQIENASIFSVEPCVLGSEGNVYRGAFTYR